MPAGSLMPVIPRGKVRPRATRPDFSAAGSDDSSARAPGVRGAPSADSSRRLVRRWHVDQWASGSRPRLRAAGIALLLPALATSASAVGAGVATDIE
jgi:hypothetical protein